MTNCVGKQSIWFKRTPYIMGAGSVVGKKEGEGPFGACFDRICPDDKFGEENWEKSESAMQKEALQIAFADAGIRPGKIRYLFGGDLLGQLIATSFGVEEYNIPLMGVYGACSTCAEALILSAMSIDGGYAEYTAAITSSHFASAEKQFRFPLAYGNQRPLSATWTVTGSGAFILSEEKKQVKITGATIGKVVDFGIKDPYNMGACMAPAACDTIVQHFKDFNRQPADYDAIITGDLGIVGRDILLDLLREQGYELLGIHMDCGMEIYDPKTQDTHAGGSGCGCSAVMLAAVFLSKIKKGIWKRILFVPTGALLSPISQNEGQNIPGIAHAVVLEKE